MKSVKSPLLGFRKIDDSNDDILIGQLREFLDQHLEILINRMLGDLGTYIDYRFHVKASAGELKDMREKLVFKKSKGVDMRAFSDFIEKVKSNSLTQLNNEIFYKEIDDMLRLSISDKVPLMTIN